MQDWEWDLIETLVELRKAICSLEGEHRDLLALIEVAIYQVLNNKKEDEEK